jgi:glycosyltransferase involved in cell wall biosynthesis
MNADTKKPVAPPKPRECIVISAYDAGLRHSEGYVARSLLARLDRSLRVILVTRKNNVSELRDSPEFKAACPNVHLVGYDLPRWAAWWKKGPRGYGLYSYLWQISWPFALKSKRRLVDRLSVVHTLNFHNDSIPSMGWILGKPSVWGPINHNEGTRQWRMGNWPFKLRLRNTLKSTVRGLAWRLDPLLALSTRKADVVFSAGSWVDQRLRLKGRANVRRKSQLGLDVSTLSVRRSAPTTGLRLVSGGRLDWIKGLDLALDALAQLPQDATLTLIGDGPCKGFLVERARMLGILDRVTFIPATSRDQLLRYYADHDIFLFPSAEAGGLAWVEALAIGLPVVGFEGPTELSEMSRHLPGVNLSKDMGTFEENVKALARAIKETASRCSDPKKISVGARQHYDWESFAAEIQNAYRAAARMKN